MAGTIKGINIQIGAETKGFKNGLMELNKSSKSLQGELSAVNKALKYDPGNVDLLKQKQDLLTKSVDDTKTKLEVLKLAKEKADADMAKGTEINQEEYRKLVREIATTSGRLESLQDQTKEFGSIAQQQLKQVGEKFAEVGGKIESAGKKMSIGVTAPILAIAGASQAAFNEVDTALDTIVTKTGATGENIDNLSESFRNVYKNLPADAQEVGDAIGEVNTQFALTGVKLEKASEQIIKFSKINEQDVTSSATSSKAAMEAFGLSADDLSSTLDATTKTAQNTGVGVDKIFDSVTKGAPQLKELGLNFAQSAEVMGRFEQKGIDSSKALSYMSKAQMAFAKDGKTLSEGMDGLIGKINKSSSETEALTVASEYFGTKGAPFMLDAIKRGSFDFSDFAGAAEDAAGIVSTTFEGTLDPVDEFALAMNNLKLVGLDISTAVQETLLPVIEAMVGKLQTFSDWFGNLSPETRGTIITIGLVAAAIGPLLVVIGTVISSVQTIIAIAPLLSGVLAGVKVAFAAIGGPVGIVVMAIGILVAKFVHAYNTSEEFRNKVDAAFAKIKEVIVDAVTIVSEKIKGFVDIGKNVMEGMWDGICDKVEWLKGKVTGVVDTIKGWFTGKEGFDTHSPSKWSAGIGGWVMQGFGSGFKDNAAFVSAKNAVNAIKGVFADAAKVSKLALEEIEKSNTPSRTFAEIGKNTMDGLAKGITENQDTAIATMEKAINLAVDGLSKGKNKKTQDKIKDHGKLLMEQYSKGVKEGSSKAVEELNTAINELTQTYDNAMAEVVGKQDSMKGKLEGHGALFSVETDEKGKTKYAVADMEGYIKTLENYATVMEDLKAKGLDKGLLSELSNMSIEDAIGYGGQLSSMQPEQLADYEAGWKEKQALAESIAKEFYGSEVDSLTTEFNKEFEEKLGAIPETTFTVGIGSLEQMILGMQSKENELYTKAQSIADEVSRILNSTMDSLGVGGGTKEKDGSHRMGLYEVPFDGYRSILHKGEMVLTQPEANRYRDGGNEGGKMGNFNVYIDKVENKDGRTTQDFMREMEHMRKSRVLAVGGV